MKKTFKKMKPENYYVVSLLIKLHPALTWR